MILCPGKRSLVCMAKTSSVIPTAIVNARPARGNTQFNNQSQFSNFCVLMIFSFVDGRLVRSQAWLIPLRKKTATGQDCWK